MIGNSEMKMMKSSNAVREYEEASHQQLQDIFDNLSMSVKSRNAARKSD